MEIVTIDDRNIDVAHICCAIGNDKINQLRANAKKQWMKERFKEGLVFKRLNDRGKVFIEYMPIETVWKPLVGESTMVINCLWVSGKFKNQGMGKILLTECIEDARQKGMNYVAVVTSTKAKPFLTDKKFFEHHGFKIVDSAPPYFELMCYEINAQGKLPVFAQCVKADISEEQVGFTFVYSNQCPFMEAYVGLLANIVEQKGIAFDIHKLENYQQAQNSGTPFGTLGIFYNRKWVTHELMTEKKFEKLVEHCTEKK